MELRHVVTCFLKHPQDGTVLLGRRSDEVGTYRSRWAGISGSVEEATPLQQALQEIQEETGLAGEQVELVAEGWPVRFPDWRLGIVWVVHPFLFTCTTPDAVRRDWEHVRFRWVAPGEIGGLNTVPRLREAYESAKRAARAGGRHGSDSVFRMVREDRDHGAAELGAWTLTGLRAALEEAAPECETAEELLERLVQTCRRAARLRPSMAPPLNAALEAYRVFRSRFSDPSRPPAHSTAAARQRLDALIRRREEAPLDAAKQAAGLIPEDAQVVTLSRSFTVLAALRAAADVISGVIVAESRPACEGRKTAETAASFGIATELVTDAAAASSCERADLVLLGADAVCGDGRVVNKTGSLALCCAADCFWTPVLVATTRSKFLPEGVEVNIEEMAPDELGEPIRDVRVRNPYFEAVPSHLVGRIVTENGVVGEKEREDLSRRLKSVYNDLFW